MICPVMTHWSEYVWCFVLKNEGSVTKASWPKESGLPKELLLQDKYLQDVVANFRKTMMKKTKKKKGKGKGGAPPPAAKPKTKAVVYVQPNYPPWKKRTLEWLDSQWDEATNSFPDPKAIKAEAQNLKKTDPD